MAKQISHKYRCIFVHVPKAGGTSIESTPIFDDQRRRTGEHVGGHCSAVEYRRAHPVEFRRYFKFAFVRNPFERVVSAFLYLDRGGSTAQDREIFEEHVAPYDGDFERFCEGVLTGAEFRTIVHFRPQVDFVCDHDGQVLVDFVGRLERAATDFHVVTKQLGISCALPHANRSKVPTTRYGAFYRHETTREIVRNAYAKDLAVFGYDYPAHWEHGRWLHLLRTSGRALRPFTRRAWQTLTRMLRTRS